MSSLRSIAKATRTKMISSRMETLSARFYNRFHLSEGDFVEFDRSTPRGIIATEGRIMSVEDVFENENGTWTAHISVIPLLVGGQLGKSVGVIVIGNHESMRCADGSFGPLREEVPETY